MRHHVRDFAESPECAALSPVSTTTESSRTRGAASCSRRKWFSPYVSDVRPRTKTRPSSPMSTRFLGRFLCTVRSIGLTVLPIYTCITLAVLRPRAYSPPARREAARGQHSPEHRDHRL